MTVPRKTSYLIFSALTQSVIAYDLINYGPTRRTLSLLIKKREKFPGSFPPYMKQIFNVYEIFIAEVVKEICKQLRLQIWPVVTTILEENKNVCYLLPITVWF